MKITYYLGAGASYNSIPIWEGQGESMIYIAESILGKINNKTLSTAVQYANFKTLHNNETLRNVFSKLKEFGERAVEYGSIDIYAKRLYLLGERTELNTLKSSLSIYFDLWESGYFKVKRPNSNQETHTSNQYYDILDKRYLSLFSIILEKVNNLPKLNNNIKFITWNYDLQLEFAFKSFLPIKTIPLESLDTNIRFLESSYSSEKRSIIHLNGHRGMFKSRDVLYETVEQEYQKSLLTYLKRLLSNQDFETGKSKLDYSNFIKYGWESSLSELEEAKQIMRNTNVLIIIGYSFPAFNRKIDLELIREFESNSINKKRVIYQDPNGSEDIIKAIFKNSQIVEYKRDKNGQFHIPDEFLAT